MLMLDSLPVVGGGCGCVCGVGRFWRQARCRVHVQHLLGVVPPLWLWALCGSRVGGWPAACVGSGFSGLVWVVWWVVCDLYSGCEHLLFCGFV